MARPRQPIAVLQANGRKHLTQQEIAAREASEVKPIAENIVAPKYLTASQKKEFNKIAEQLQRLNIMGETDIDALARYILSKELYVKLTKQLKKKEVISNPVTLDLYMKNQNKAYSQCRQAANDLGLTISSRCKLAVPKSQKKENEPVNKFAKFIKTG